MPIYNPAPGVFRGTQLVQRRGQVGGNKKVFVPIQGNKDDLKFPTFGSAIANPFRGPAKMFAGDLAEYRTDANGRNPKYYILKTYKAVSGSGTTINIVRDGFEHIPFVGDSLMVAPDVIGGEGTASKVTAVAKTTVTVSETTYDVWQLTMSYTLGTLNLGDILVESEAVAAAETHETKEMLVKNVNSVCDCDYDMFIDPSLTYGAQDDTNFDDARYHVCLALGGTMYTSKMSPLPACVLALNRSNVNGWFRLDWYDMSDAVHQDEFARRVRFSSSNPSTSTKGEVGDIIITSGKIYALVAVSGNTYTWKSATIS